MAERLEQATPDAAALCWNAGARRSHLEYRAAVPGRDAESLAMSIALGRVGEPSEVAEAILWLLSEEASYVTGAVLPVHGGR